MNLTKLELLSKEEVEQIHYTSLELLDTVGVRVESEEALNILKNNGANVDLKTRFAKFPEDLVNSQLKHVPENFKLYGRDGTYQFEVNTKSTQFATVGTPVLIYDPSSKNNVRKTVLEDTINQIRVVDNLKNIMCSHVDVWPNDVPYLETHYHTIRAWAEHSIKPYGLGCYGRLASKDMMELTSIVVGGEDELKRNPRLIGFFNPTSYNTYQNYVKRAFRVCGLESTYYNSSCCQCRLNSSCNLSRIAYSNQYGGISFNSFNSVNKKRHTSILFYNEQSYGSINRECSVGLCRNWANNDGRSPISALL